MAEQNHMNPRQDLYIHLLHAGLLNIRLFADRGNAEMCRIEADHLHNVPGYIVTGNPEDHSYYYNTERELYVARIQSVPDVYDTVAFIAYSAIWPKLKDMLINSL